MFSRVNDELGQPPKAAVVARKIRDRTPPLETDVTASSALSHPSTFPIILLVPLLLWIWVCWDWPARLGFYSDDWMVLLHPFVGTDQAFRDVARMVATRPVSIPFIWLAQVVTDWDPTRSQILNVAMFLATAVGVGTLTAALISTVRDLRAGMLVGASIAGASFIVFPSNVGTFAWGTVMTTAVPALPLFCVATSLLLHSKGGWWRLLLGLALGLLSHLSYEAFYFQEVTFILLAAVLSGSNINDLNWRALTGAVIVNIGCIIFNRTTSAGVQKPFNPDFFHSFVWAYRHLPETFGHATREHAVLITILILIAGLSGAVCLAHLVGAARTRRAAFVTTCGIVASSFLYAFAGYPLVMEGPLSRVSIVIATHYAVTSGVLAAAAWCSPRLRQRPAVLFCLCAAIGLFALGLTARSRVSDWADTWSYELARLARLPPEVTSADVSAGGSQRIYLAIDERESSMVEPAMSIWEIRGAVAWAIYKKTMNREQALDLWHGSRNFPLWFSARQDWFNRWDGKSFQQGSCDGSGVVLSDQGQELWLWKTSTSDLIAAAPVWERGCR